MNAVRAVAQSPNFPAFTFTAASGALSVVLVARALMAAKATAALGLTILAIVPIVICAAAIRTWLEGHPTGVAYRTAFYAHCRSMLYQTGKIAFFALVAGLFEEAGSQHIKRHYRYG